MGRMKVIDGQAAVMDEQGTMLFHICDPERGWHDLQAETAGVYQKPCPWCEQGVPCCSTIYRYVMDCACDVGKPVLIGASA